MTNRRIKIRSEQSAHQTSFEMCTYSSCTFFSCAKPSVAERTETHARVYTLSSVHVYSNFSFQCRFSVIFSFRRMRSNTYTRITHVEQSETMTIRVRELTWFLSFRTTPHILSGGINTFFLLFLLLISSFPDITHLN